MTYLAIKTLVTALLIVAISEIAKRSTLLGGLLASIPIVSVLAIIWLYVDTRDNDQIAALSTSIVWLVIPSLSFFVVLPLMLRHEINFWLSLTTSLGVMLACYYMLLVVLGRFGVRL